MCIRCKRLFTVREAICQEAAVLRIRLEKIHGEPQFPVRDRGRSSGPADVEP